MYMYLLLIEYMFDPSQDTSVAQYPSASRAALVNKLVRLAFERRSRNSEVMMGIMSALPMHLKTAGWPKIAAQHYVGGPHSYARETSGALV